MEKVLIINTGGTFNKKYNAITGQLEIDTNNSSLKDIFKHWLYDFEINNIINKDSLDMTNEDRSYILKTIQNSEYKKIIVIHGTDTINVTAKFLNDKIKNKTIVMTGSMVPYSINPIEAVANFSSSVGFIYNCNQSGIYISMNGLIDIYTNIQKDKKLGKFIYDSQQ